MDSTFSSCAPGAALAAGQTVPSANAGAGVQPQNVESVQLPAAGGSTRLSRRRPSKRGRGCRGGRKKKDTESQAGRQQQTSPGPEHRSGPGPADFSATPAGIQYVLSLHRSHRNRLRLLRWHDEARGAVLEQMIHTHVDGIFDQVQAISVQQLQRRVAQSLGVGGEDLDAYRGLFAQRLRTRNEEDAEEEQVVVEEEAEMEDEVVDVGGAEEAEMEEEEEASSPVVAAPTVRSISCCMCYVSTYSVTMVVNDFTGA